MKGGKMVSLVCLLTETVSITCRVLAINKEVSQNTVGVIDLSEAQQDFHSLLILGTGEDCISWPL